MSEPFVINTETFRNDIIEITAEGDVLTIANRLGEHSLVIDSDIQIGEVIDTVDSMLVDHSDGIQAAIDDGIDDIDAATAEGLDEIQAKIDTFDPDEGTLFGHENETVTGDWNFDGELNYGGDPVATEVYVDAEVFSGAYTDLSGVPSTFTPESHGDEAHTEDYAKEADLFSGEYTDLSGVPSDFTPESHGNEAHGDDFIYSSTDPDVDVQIDEQNGIVNFVTN